MTIKKDIIIFEKFLNSLKVRGYKKTLDLLSFKDDNEANLSSTKDELIVNEVIKIFNITKEDLFFNRYEKSTENKYAIGLCVFYFYQYKTLGEIQKNIFKNKNKSQLSRYRQIIIDLKTNSKVDLKYIKIKNILDKLILNN
jgi:hypothetical protein